MLDIRVQTPTRTPSLYEFRCEVRSQVTRGGRLRAGFRRGSNASELVFGYRATNFEIEHDEIWDGLYPLFFLTRNGGPLFESTEDGAVIRFDYPIPRVVRDFYIGRAAEFGFRIKVEAETTEATFDRPTSGEVLAFGGGKDSRLLLGVLRELGHDVTVYTAKAAYAKDIDGILTAEALHGSIVDRLMPGLMLMPHLLWFGSTVASMQRVIPWHQSYDLAAPGPLLDWSAMFASLGASLEVRTPATVLPPNIVQRILHDRYPELYRHQVSTRPGSRSTKSLHTALVKLDKGYSIAEQCSDEDFELMLGRFVRSQMAEPPDFGYRDGAQLTRLESRVLIWRNRDDPRLASVRDVVPAAWEQTWPDYIHPYLHPDNDPGMLAIFGEYADSIDDPDEGLRAAGISI